MACAFLPPPTCSVSERVAPSVRSRAPRCATRGPRLWEAGLAVLRGVPRRGLEWEAGARGWRQAGKQTLPLACSPSPKVVDLLSKGQDGEQGRPDGREPRQRLYPGKRWWQATVSPLPGGGATTRETLEWKQIKTKKNQKTKKIHKVNKKTESIITFF